MPFLTEELWQRLASGAEAARSRSRWRRIRSTARSSTDPEAEREIGMLQEIVTAGAHPARRDEARSRSSSSTATLYCAHRGARRGAAPRRSHPEAGQRDARDSSRGRAANAGVMRSTAEFDLVLDVPKAQDDAQRKRLEKENEQLEKNIANSERQLGDESFLSKAPAKVVESIRAKLAEYEAQLAKSRTALDGLRMIDVSHPEIVDAVRRALEEDIGTGDVTTRRLRPGRSHGQRRVSSRASRMIVAGVGAAAADLSSCAAASTS